MFLILIDLLYDLRSLQNDVDYFGDATLSALVLNLDITEGMGVTQSSYERIEVL
jgi:hypothetical protein